MIDIISLLIRTFLAMLFLSVNLGLIYLVYQAGVSSVGVCP